MKNIKKLNNELGERKDFHVINSFMQGGMGIFTAGAKKGMSVVWSYDGGWEHVSIDGVKRTPTWDEMCELKDMFWEGEEECVQFHPRKSEYVNLCDHCLHIWKPIEKYTGKMPSPMPEEVL